MVRKTIRFVAIECALWCVLYVTYMLLRDFAIGTADTAYANATRLIDTERAAGVFHEVAVQRALVTDLDLEGFFDAYYLYGFFPVVIAVLTWLGFRQRDAYRKLRTWLLVSIGFASVVYWLIPTAPPRLVPHIGIADTVGLAAGHDNGSFSGIEFNPYAAMPSMHVGWSFLLALVGVRVFRQPLVRLACALHPIFMLLAVTATGNHYFFDSAAGVLVALVAIAVCQLPARLAGRSPLGSHA